jgi:PTS system nitrogen regulatory IIA component
MFLNVVQLAESLGVAESVIEGWVRHEGLPSVADRGRLLFDRAEVVTWAVSRGLAAKVGFLAPPQGEVKSGGKLELLVRAGGIWRDVLATNVLELFGTIVAKLPGATPPVRQILQQRLRDPHGLSWAPIGGGLALPHLRTPVSMGREGGLIALILLTEPMTVAEPAPDEEHINRLLFFIAPSPRAHLEILGQISAALTRGNLQAPIREGAADEQIMAAIIAAEAEAKK